ncbi:MAG: L,D-transpeptidase [Gaiellaceae bacterium]
MLRLKTPITLALALALAAMVASTASATTDAPGKERVSARDAQKAIKLPTNARLVRLTAPVRKAPRDSARVVHRFAQFRGDFRPTVVYVLSRRVKKRSADWYRVFVPGRPNGRKGWMKVDELRLNEPAGVEIIVRRGARKLELRRGKKLILRTKVAVGKPGAETPLGRFYVAAAFKPGHRFLGKYAFETSAYSRLSQWPGGGIVGIHGTYQPELLGKAVSHGCVRVSNEAVLAIKRHIELGATFTVIP